MQHEILEISCCINIGTNRELHWIYAQQIRKWFKDETRKDIQMLAFDIACKEALEQIHERNYEEALGRYWYI